MTSPKAQLLIKSTMAIWVDHDLSAIETYFGTDLKIDGVLQDTSLGPEDFRELVPVIAALMKNIQIEPLIVTEGGDWVQMLYRCTAVSAVGKFPIDFVGQLCVRFVEDKIVECYDTIDYLTLFEQMRQLPEHSHELLFSGENLFAKSL